jgi:IclR family mhp operon transcriptional activator
MEKGVPIRAISRCVSVLQAINRAGSLTMMDVAHASGVPYPTACRIVQTLLLEGLIEREPARKRYRPTALVQTLSHGFQAHGRLVEAARPHIVDLTKRHGWPVSLASHVGQRMVIRDSTHTLTSLTFNNYYPGYTLPILESASGCAHIAFTSEEDRANILSTLRAVPEMRTAIRSLCSNAACWSGRSKTMVTPPKVATDIPKTLERRLQLQLRCLMRLASLAP